MWGKTGRWEQDAKEATVDHTGLTRSSQEASRKAGNGEATALEIETTEASQRAEEAEIQPTR